nr:hypothetical protein [Megavirus caiporensis]
MLTLQKDCNGDDIMTSLMIKFIESLNNDICDTYFNICVVMNINMSKGVSQTICKIVPDIYQMDEKPRIFYYQNNISTLTTLLGLLKNNYSAEDAILSDPTPKPGDYIGQDTSLWHKIILKTKECDIIVKRDQILCQTKRKYPNKTTKIILKKFFDIIICE